jgi:hypothetical protein
MTFGNVELSRSFLRTPMLNVHSVIYNPKHHLETLLQLERRE